MFSKQQSGSVEYPEESMVRDLCTLQINTIIKSQITGGTMPAARYALCEVSKCYANKLIAMGADADEVKPDNTVTGGYSRFDIYRTSAKKQLAQLAQNDPDNLHDINMLQRIKNNSNRIKAMFAATDDTSRNEYSNKQLAEKFDQGMKDLALQRDDYIALRKFWELGTEEIAIQTVVQLDGDVTTRVQPKFATQDSLTIHQLHQSSVNLSYQYWKSLIQLVGDVFNTVLSSIFKGSGKK
jgi:hypothetical protein